MSSELRELLEETFAREHCVLIGRGTTAIALALRALGLEGRPVAVPASICYAVPLAVALSGNQPLFVDVSPDTGNLDLDALAALEQRPAGLIAVTTVYGPPLPMRRLADWCEREGVVLIEDASLAAGATVDGARAGSFGACAVVSFGAGKLADAGNGAVLLTDDAALAEEVAAAAQELPPFDDEVAARLVELAAAYRELSRLSRRFPRVHLVTAALLDLHEPAFAYRFPDGALPALERTLRGLGEELRARRALAAVYEQEFGAHELVRPLTPPDAGAVWRYSVRVLEGRDRVLEQLWRAGEHASAWYPGVDRLFTPPEEWSARSFPGADLVEAQVLNLWVDAGRDEERVRRTARLMLEALGEERR